MSTSTDHVPCLSLNDALDLLTESFHNTTGSPCHGLADGAGFHPPTFHFPDGESQQAELLDEPDEYHLRIYDRTCVLSAATPIPDAVACFRNYAAELMRAADYLEAEEREWIAHRAERLAREQAMEAAG